MPIAKFEIELDNRHRSYFAGNTITGQVVVVVTEKAKLIRGIKLKLYGKAKTHWQKTAGRATQRFTGQEVYIDKQICLVGYETDSSDLILNEGRYTYPFSYRLPASLPSSFSHEYGKVRYYLEATIGRNWKLNHTSKMAFSVNAILDLNLEPEAAKEGEISGEKALCYLLCAHGRIGVHLKVAKKGFVPGERIGFFAHLFNHSNRRVSFTSVALIQELKFIADFAQKTVSEKLAVLQGPDLVPRQSTDWIVPCHISTLKVPSIPPSRLDGCKIIHISYHLQFKMQTTFNSTAKGILPIIIGTIPLRRDFAQILATDGGISELLSPSLIHAPSSLSLFSDGSYTDLPPPSYEEATKHGRRESNCSDPPDYGDIENWNSFIPKYASYTFSAK